MTTKFCIWRHKFPSVFNTYKNLQFNTTGTCIQEIYINEHLGVFIIRELNFQ